MGPVHTDPTVRRARARAVPARMMHKQAPCQPPPASAQGAAPRSSRPGPSGAARLRQLASRRAAPVRSKKLAPRDRGSWRPQVAEAEVEPSYCTAPIKGPVATCSPNRVPAAGQAPRQGFAKESSLGGGLLSWPRFLLMYSAVPSASPHSAPR